MTVVKLVIWIVCNGECGWCVRTVKLVRLIVCNGECVLSRWLDEVCLMVSGVGVFMIESDAVEL